MKKHVLRVLGLALALIAAGCANPLNEDLSAPIAGKGVVAVSVGPGARTLLPNAAALYYTLAFTSGEKTVSGTISSGAAGSFELDAGTWSLVVTGYLDAAASLDEANVVASGNAGDIEVSAGQTTPTTVELSAFISAGQSGTLSYDITFPSAVTVAVLTARLTSGEPVSVDLLDEDVDQSIETDGGVTMVEGTRSLSVGYHEVSVYLYGASLGRLMKSDTAHIYKGLITALVENFASGDFSAGPDVAALNAALDTAQAARADIGLLGEEAAAVTALDAAIVAAKAARDDTLATQPEVDAAVTALTTATEAFTEAKAAANQQAATDFTSAHTAALDLTVDTVAITDKTAAQSALTAYNGLSAAVKALLPADTETKLQALLDKITELETPAADANQAAATTFTNAHTAALALTVDTVAIGNKDAVNAALTAYNGLSAAVKALLPADTETKLQALLDKITELETPAADANQAAATAFTNAHTAALALTVDTVTTGNKGIVQAALTAYNGLSAEVKALLPADTGTKLQALLDKITELEIPAASGNSSITLSFSDRGAGAFSHDSFTLSKSSDEPETIALLGDWDSQKWVVDGKEKGTDTSLEVKAADYSIGEHNLTVTVVKGDVPWSKTLTFTVGE